MRVFNLAEELVKEREKNKTLEEENKKLNNVIYKDYVVKDLENKNKWLKNDNKVYKSRIEEAIKYIEKTDTFQIVHSTDELAEMLREKTIKDLLDILKGDNK